MKQRSPQCTHKQGEDEPRREAPLPEHFAAMEQLRDIALYFHKNSKRHKIYKDSMKELDILQGVWPPKIDNAKWESRQQLVDHVKRISKESGQWEDSPKWKVLQQCLGKRDWLADPPPESLSNERLQALQEVPAVLGLVQATVAKSQGDQSLLGFFEPNLCGLKLALGRLDTQFARKYLEELTAVVARHMTATKLWPPPYRAMYQTP